jgi:lysophospholipase L1-like esterase
MLICAGIAANAAPVRIVAIGASNTHGWYVSNQGAYPAQLEALLIASAVLDRRHSVSRREPTLR